MRTDEEYRDGVERTARVVEASRFSEWSAGSPGRPNTYWLIEERGRAGSETPIAGLADGRRVLPIFGFEEEARLFVRLSFMSGRRVLRIGTDELVSLLFGPFDDVELVALDPLSDAETDMLNGSVSLSRQRFLDFLLGTLIRTEIPAEPAPSTRPPVPSSQAQTKSRTP